MNLNASQSPVADTEIHDTSELVEYFRRGETPPEQWRVGMEHEKIGLHLPSLDRVPYEGERGICALLERIAAVDGWKPQTEDGDVVALIKEGASITLEPGGQLELSGAPLRTIHEICSEFTGHVALAKQVSEPLGIAWLRLGIDPLHPVEAIPRMPKQRYRIMRDYLPSRGECSLEMMHATATVQANFDYADEADMVEKMRLAIGASPVVTAIFANSSISAGKPNGFISRRSYVWQHTDPDRTGLLPFVFDPDFGYARYVEWALDVPMFFLVRDERYLSAGGRTFRAFLAGGHEGHRATLGDFDRHLTTLFPEVRLKRFIEVRGADAVPAELTCGLPALWKGLLYDAGARSAGLELLLGTRPEARAEGLKDVARRGLGAQLAGKPVLDFARELVEISSEGLRRIGHAGRVDPDERPYLEPVREQLEAGESPGQEVLRRWHEEWDGRVDHLIEHARY